MIARRILVLGNDPQINSINFKKLAPDVITLGVNRIWMAHIPHYYFFHDIEITKELSWYPDTLVKLKSQSTCYTSDWLISQTRKNRQAVPNWAKVFPRVDRFSFPDSICTSLALFNRHYMIGTPRVYYIAGVSLKWQEPSHFWKKPGVESMNTHSADWYHIRFDKMLDNFRKLKIGGMNFISVNPNSRINSMCRYESINTLYSKR